MQRLLWAVTILLGAAFGARATTLQCDDCSSQAFEAMAANNLSALYQGPMYIVDVPNGVVRKYVLATEGCTGNPEDPCVVYPGEVSVAPHITNGVAQAGGIIRAYGLHTIYVNPGHPGMPSDAYGVVTTSLYAEAIDQYIRTYSNATKYNEARTILDVLQGDYFNPTALFINIKLVFSDGSTIIAVWDRSAQRFVNVKGQERDASRNLIPQRREDVVGQRYEMNAGDGSNGLDDFYDMYQHFQNMGINVVDGGGIGTYRRAWTCALSTDGQTYTCTFFWIPT